MLGFTKRVLSIVVAAAVLLVTTNISDISALPLVPDSIKIGLTASDSPANNFVVKSSSGISISFAADTANNISIVNTLQSGIMFRKDVYYNIDKGITKEIDFTKAAIYTGDVIGPYHIQVGGIYGTIADATQASMAISSSNQSVFLAYDQGWRVWTNMYTEEDECLEEIQLMKNELGDLGYSVIAPDKRRILVLDAATEQPLYIFNGECEITIQSQDQSMAVPTIEYNNSKYRGKLLVKRNTNCDITVINQLPFEQYLYGVVPTEVPYSWNMETLKAQAVAARNYAIVSMGKHKDLGYDLCNGQHCQAYKGFSKENERTNQAVDETKSKLLTYNGKLVTPFYHSSSGGYTENSENVWNEAIPYIRAVDDKYGLGSPYDNWTNTIDCAGIKEKLTVAGIDLGDIININVLEISAFGRVQKIEIVGTKSSKILEKEKIRSVLGNSILKSIWYTVNTDADIFIKGRIESQTEKKRGSTLYAITATGVKKLTSTNNILNIKGVTTNATAKIIPTEYTFAGKGWGHGLGMSQYGAKGMAEAGFKYNQILEYYYTGSKVQ